MRSASAERTVFVLAGEYSAAPDDPHPVSVFEKARSVKNPGRALEDLMSRAGERGQLTGELTRHRDAYFAGARDAADLEQRQQIWQREQFSSLFNH